MYDNEKRKKSLQNPTRVMNLDFPFHFELLHTTVLLTPAALVFSTASSLFYQPDEIDWSHVRAPAAVPL
jgi:hypothetical protein